MRSLDRQRQLLQSVGDDVPIASLLAQLSDQDERGLLVIGLGRQVRSVNPAARTLIDFSGQLPARVSEVIQDPEFSFAVGDCLHDRRSMWYELYLPDPDRLLRFHLMPIVDAVGAPTLVIASVEDITRLRHLETVRRDFVANVSHELRTPIASINLLVETLQRGAIDNRDDAEHFLRRIEVETQAMARLVEELLELSRLETGVLHLVRETVDVRDLLALIASRLMPTGRDKRVVVAVDVPAGLPRVSADPKRLEQVLMNLVHNGIKFTPAGGTVTMRAYRHGPGVQIDVVDTGVGMDTAEAERIFERFYKVDKGRNRAGGAGLGLAIARHLLDLHGSQLQVVTEPHRGSRFSFGLPLADPVPGSFGR